MASESIRRSLDEDDTCSEASSAANNGSVISTVPDRHGFLGGSQYTAEPTQLVPPSVVLRREQKWLRMLDQWEKYMMKNYKKVRERCRKGIPPSLRPRAWLYLCGGQSLMEQSKGLYDELCTREGDPRWVEDIRKDLHRQFPYHEMFISQEGVGQRELNLVLKCYSILNPAVGYCQAQAPLAAFLLMHMPAEQAFWCLVSISDKYLEGYYSQGMESIQLDGDILFGLLKKVAPRVHKHIKKQKMEPILYMTEWFLCVFTRSLPWTTVLRLWDMFLCEGVKVIFKTALVIMKYSLDRSGTLKKCPTMYETLEVLRNPPAHILEEEFLITQNDKMCVIEALPKTIGRGEGSLVGWGACPHQVTNSPSRVMWEKVAAVGLRPCDTGMSFVEKTSQGLAVSVGATGMVIRLDITEEDFRKEHEKQVKKRRAAKINSAKNNK